MILHFVCDICSKFKSFEAEGATELIKGLEGWTHKPSIVSGKIEFVTKCSTHADKTIQSVAQ